MKNANDQISFILWGLRQRVGLYKGLYGKIKINLSMIFLLINITHKQAFIKFKITIDKGTVG